MIANLQYDADPVTVTITAEDEMGNIGRCEFTADVVGELEGVGAIHRCISEIGLSFAPFDGKYLIELNSIKFKLT